MTTLLYDPKGLLAREFPAAVRTTKISELVQLLRGAKHRSVVLVLDDDIPSILDQIVLVSQKRAVIVLAEDVHELAHIAHDYPFIICGTLAKSFLEYVSAYLGQLSPLRAESTFLSVTGSSTPIAEARKKASTVAASDATVLILGESGTGKELFARGIHQGSKRIIRPFIAVNCAAIPAELVELEFFGSTKGAFTDATKRREGYFAAAEGGTLFLDEIGELSLATQAKLLRTLQERIIVPVGSSEPITTNVRIIAATHRSLERAVKEGTFREDLFYRLNVVTIELPALRNRKQDFPELVQTLLQQLARKHRRTVPVLDSLVMDVFENFEWPGNIRELENVLEQLLVLNTGNVITREHLPPRFSGILSDKSTPEFLLPPGLSLKKAQKAIEDYLIAKALKETSNNRTHAAKLLEISHRGLLYKLEPEQAGKVPRAKK